LQFEQKRLFSDTCGLEIIAFSGSVDGKSGMDMSPAPNCLRLLRADVLPVRRDPWERLVRGEEPVPKVTGKSFCVMGALCFWLTNEAGIAAKPQMSQ
jgi:hypothetical protein